jgi:hypothetical protein
MGLGTARKAETSRMKKFSIENSGGKNISGLSSQLLRATAHND